MAEVSAPNSAAEERRRGVRGLLADVSDAVVSVFFPAGCRIRDALANEREPGSSLRGMSGVV
jgi:hypothetical protein